MLQVMRLLLKLVFVGFESEQLGKCCRNPQKMPLLENVTLPERMPNISLHANGVCPHVACLLHVNAIKLSIIAGIH